MTGVLKSGTLDPATAGGLKSILLTYATSGTAQEQIAALLTDADLDVTRKLFLLGIVEGAKLDKLPENWIAALGSLIASGPEELRWPAVSIVQSRNLAEHDAPRAADGGRRPAHGLPSPCPRRHCRPYD